MKSMQKTSKKALSLLLSLVLALSLVAPVTQVAYAAATEVNGGETITSGGEYTLPDGATGTITIDTSETVTIIGSGVKWDESFQYSEDTVVYKNLKFNYTNDRADLVLKDIIIENRDDTAPLVNFAAGDGDENCLTIEGTVVLDMYGVGQGTHAAIHAAQGATLTIGGSGTLYLYKQSGGAGIGGNKGEMNGDITFAMTGSAFIKGTKQGAVIGAGTGAKGTGEPGSVTFESGEYNIISNSRGGAIGGSAGSDGASEGTEVCIFGGTVNINNDFSGASIGGGGFDAGNDASGGTVTIAGGSLRIYVDKNAASNVTGKYYKGLPLEEGVNNVSMTAARTNISGEKVYLCVVDTAGVAPDANGQYTVKVDGKDYYTGGLHQYGYVQEALDKETGEQLTISTTPSNWYKNGETRLFLYLTGEDHTISINDQKPYTVKFSAAADGTLAECNGGAFELPAPPELKLTPTEVKLDAAGDTTQLEATLTGVEGGTITWTSADDKVATVDDTGLVTAVASGITTVTASCGELTATCTVLVGTKPIIICPGEADAKVTLSDGIGYTYLEKTYAGKAVETEGTQPAGLSYDLLPGNYTVTITKDGFYASQFSFAVTDTGKLADAGLKTLTGNLKSFLLDGTTNVLSIPMTAFTASSNTGAWDGKTLDVSWYGADKTTMEISTPAQLAGMAAIVNGIYNAEITTILDDMDGDGVKEAYTPDYYAALADRKIIAKVSSNSSTGGPNGNNQVSTSDYWYGVKADGVTPSDFKGQTVKITKDLDMGGYLLADGNWSGARYMTIGGQSLMHYIDYKNSLSDGLSHLGSSFNGVLDGQGHILKNVYCDRYAGGSNFGDSQSVGIVGRLGIHDNDDSGLAAVNPTVRNIAVTGYIYARRSVGGIVGKIGQTSATRLGDGSTGGIIENCVNFAAVKSTDSKGVGGIVGAGWNKGLVRNCANFGSITSTYSRGIAGGISGSNEIAIKNCYNMGVVTSAKASGAMSLGTNSGGDSWENCYWLTGTATGGGVYSASTSSQAEIHEITANYDGTNLSAAAFMQSENFVSLLNKDGSARNFRQAADTNPIMACLKAAGYSGAPVPVVFTQDAATVTEVVMSQKPNTLTYAVGQTFDPTGLKLEAKWSDSTTETLEAHQYDVRIGDESVTGRKLTTADTTVTVSGSYGGKDFSFDLPITVVDYKLESIAITANPNKMVFAKYEKLDLTGMEVTATFTNYTSAVLQPDQYTATMNDLGLLTVTYVFTKDNICTATLQLTKLATEAPAQDEAGNYLLSCANDVIWFGDRVRSGDLRAANAKVTADIEMPDTFVGIGRTSDSYAYTGTFDGCGYTITLHADGNNNSAALFLNVGGGAVLKNITVAGSVKAESSMNGAAGLVARASGSRNTTLTIENCVNKADVSAKSYVGGLIGYVSNRNVQVVIKDCVNYGTITGGWTENAYAGGISGNLENGTITGCLNVGSVTAQGKRVGGITGGKGNNKEITIENCGNIGAISGDSAVGGILGYSDYRATVTGCLNAGSVTATTAGGSTGVGGIAGQFGGTMTDVYNLGDVSCTDKTASATMGVGGIIGYDQEGTLQNAYNAGAVTAAGSASAGALIGARETRYGITVKNSYYLSVDGLDAYPSIPNKDTESNVASKTEAELKALAATLGNKFKANVLGYPLLTWQPDAVAEAPATCTASGTKAHYTADGKYYSDAYGLNEIKLEDITLSANGHTLKATPAQDATCTEDGHEAYWTCETCGWLFSDAAGENHIDKIVVRPALNHAGAALVAAKAPTCTESGNSAYWFCEACGKYLSDSNGVMNVNDVHDSAADFALSAKGHGTLTATSAKAPTCTEDGHEAYWTCPDCDQLFSDAEGENPITGATVIPALNHKNATQVAAKAATCAEAGNAAYWVCPDCGKLLADNNGEMDITKAYDSADSFVVPATGDHVWDDGVVTTQPTTTSEGVKTFTCTKCHETKTESIPKLEPSGVKTGDSGIVLWVALASLTALGGLCLQSRKKREA